MTRRMLVAALAAIVIPIRAAKALLKPKYGHFAVEFPYEAFAGMPEGRQARFAKAIAFLASIKGDLQFYESPDGMRFLPMRSQSGNPRAALSAYLVDASDKKLMAGGDLSKMPWFRMVRNGDQWSLVPITRAEALGQA